MDSQHAKTVLVVDDDVVIRSYVKLILEAEGYVVLEAEDGKAALERLEAARPDLLVVDIFMPEKDGIEIIVEAREQGLTIPILAMSGGGEIHAPEFLSYAVSLGANAVLQKPFSRDQIVNTLKSLLL